MSLLGLLCGFENCDLFLGHFLLRFPLGFQLRNSGGDLLLLELRLLAVGLLALLYSFLLVQLTHGPPLLVEGHLVIHDLLIEGRLLLLASDERVHVALLLLTSLLLFADLSLQFLLHRLLLLTLVLQSHHLGLGDGLGLLELLDSLHGSTGLLDLLGCLGLFTLLLGLLFLPLDLILKRLDFVLLPLHLALHFLLGDDLVGLLAQLLVGLLLVFPLLQDGLHGLHQLVLGEWLLALGDEAARGLLHLLDLVQLRPVGD